MLAAINIVIPLWYIASCLKDIVDILRNNNDTNGKSKGVD